jgi:hypothetical protein
VERPRDNRRGWLGTMGGKISNAGGFIEQGHSDSNITVIRELKMSSDWFFECFDKSYSHHEQQITNNVMGTKTVILQYVSLSYCAIYIYSANLILHLHQRTRSHAQNGCSDKIVDR